MVRAALREVRRALAIGSGTVISRMTGRGRRDLVSPLERMQRWPQERLHCWRRERLRELLIFSIAHVPWYAERLSRIDLLDPKLDLAETLTRIPVLTKADLRVAGNRLLATDRSRPVHVASTSGSSGAPVTVRIDHDATCWVRAAQRRGFRWHGVDPLEPRVLLLSAPQEGLHRIKHRAVDLAIWRRLFQFADLSPHRLLEVASYIRRYRPSFITAYPSVLAALCWACLDAGVDLRDSGVRLIHSQSEVLQDVHRDAIARVFGVVPILDEYGCVEVGGMGYSCGRGVLHPSHDHVIMEVVDDEGRPVQPGEIGRVLLTPLHARAMPLIRYEVGDRAVMVDSSCPEHFPGSPAIQRIEGRTFEAIYDQTGTRFSGGIVHFIVKKAGAIGELREYLAVQERQGDLLFQVVPDGSVAPDLEARLSASGRSVFGAGMSVRVEVRTRISRPPEKKARYFLSRIEGNA